MPKKGSLLTEEQLDEYTSLLYLSKAEIVYLLKCFSKLGPEEIRQNLHYRFPKYAVMEAFPNLKHNPFSDRIFRVFSSYKDDRFSFEDMLDLCSAMSENCPVNVKALWAFQIFDLNGDDRINHEDICRIVDRITFDRQDRSKYITSDEKQKIANTILNDADLLVAGGLGMGPNEFQHVISKIPDFKNCFYFTV